jgi:hypothetical protein
MSGIFPKAPAITSTEPDATPVREWVMPVPKRNYARVCTALPPGMPDCLEVSIVRSGDGVERTTAVIYGRRAYLIHYEFKPN